MVGPLRIGIPLFNIYLNEADELSRRLTTEVAEWAMELHRPIGETPIALAHSLAGSSATVGFNDLSQLARALEHAQTRSQAIGYGTTEEARLFVDTAEEIRRLLHQFAAGFKQPAPDCWRAWPSTRSNRRAASRRPPPRPTCRRPPAWASRPGARVRAHRPRCHAGPAGRGRTAARQPPDAVQRQRPGHDWLRHARHARDALGVAELRRSPAAQRACGVVAPLAEREIAIEGTEDIDAVDAVDPSCSRSSRKKAGTAAAAGHPVALGAPPRRGQPCVAGLHAHLHTLRAARAWPGAMRLGEMAHRLETRIEQLLADPPVAAADVEQLQSRADGLTQVFELLRARDAQACAERLPAVAAEPPAEPVLSVTAMPPAAAAPVEIVEEGSPLAELQPAPAGAAAPARGGGPPSLALRLVALRAGRRHGASWPTSRRARRRPVRVRAPLLDRLVNQAGEVSITRSRIESEVGQIARFAGRPDRQPRAPAPAVARHRAAGRDADESRLEAARRRRSPSIRWSSTASRASRNSRA